MQFTIRDDLIKEGWKSNRDKRSESIPPVLPSGLPGEIFFGLILGDKTVITTKL